MKNNQFEEEELVNKKIKELETNEELIIKTKAEWIKKSLVNKLKYET